ncbi:MAG: phosphatidylserine decarboxylase [Woeseiaceae bacterium]|nr:phosphatidylserine decarboxylase [Woeseiaceae bacterium]
MQGRRNPFVAREGIPFLIATIVAGWLAYRYLDLVWLGAAAAVFVILFLVFRDPRRVIPSSPLGVVSPADGRVESVERIDEGAIQGRAHRIVIRISSLGTYTARSPVEGKIMDLATQAGDQHVDLPTNALWMRTDEGEDVVLKFGGYRFGLPPKSFVRYGERLGQGARCAYLRLTRYAEIHLPIDSRVQVEPGQRLVAGLDMLAKLPHP